MGAAEPGRPAVDVPGDDPATASWPGDGAADAEPRAVPSGDLPAEPDDAVERDVAEPDDAADDMPAQVATTGGTAPRNRSGWLFGGGTAAVVTWLVATPVAMALPALSHRSPFSIGASSFPLTAAFLLIVALVGLAYRWRGEIVAGAAAGFAAAWVALMLRAALHGTPFGFGGLIGDMGRMAASATRYTTTLASSDSLDPRLPSEYPPLYAWLVGRAAVLTGQPAWHLLAYAEVLFTSAAVLAGFLLWRRLVNSWLALGIASLTLVTWSDPRKAFETLTLAIFIPWVIEVFARPPRGRMHWLPAGLLGGFITITYQAWMVYAAFGVLALLVIAWRTEPDRWAYFRRLGLVVLVAFVVASWYVVPFGWATLTSGGQSISDLYPASSINHDLFPFLELKPLGVLQLIGLVGMIWLWRSVWWARPLLLLTIGVYGYRLISMVRYVLTQHTGFLHYTNRLYDVLFTVAGVLVLAHVAPIVLRRLRYAPPRLAVSAVLAVVLAWSANAFTAAWMPETGSRYAVSAFTEPLPGGGYSRYAPKEGRRSSFPVKKVDQAVREVLGPNPRRVTLSVDDRLFSYLPWPGFIENDRTAGSTLSRWDDRYEVIRGLVGTTDPSAFATRSSDTEFGPIDIFVLRKQPDGWAWKDQRFQAAQFAPQYWTVVDGLPAGIVVAIRR